MDILGGIGLLSGGVRAAKQLFTGNSKSSGAQFGRGMAQSIGAQVVAQRDGDGDGQLTMDELGAPRKIFERLDADGNGQLSATEINEGFSSAQNARQVERVVARYMESHDSDFDSLVSGAESGFDKDVFELIDSSKDGYLNRGELTSAHRRHHMDISA